MSSDIRVLYVIDSLARGGAEQSLVQMLRPLGDRGVEPVVAHLSAGPGLEQEVDALGVRRLTIDPASRRDAVVRLRRVIEEHRPDIVHTTLFESDLAGRLAGHLSRTPVVSTIANVAYGREQVADARVRRSRLRAAQLADATTARLVRRFHAVSNVVAETMIRRLVLPRHKVEAIPRGRDSQVLGRRTPERQRRSRRELGVADGEQLLLAVGRQEFQKGFDVLLEAMAHLEPTPTLLIAGRDGNQTELLRSMADRLPASAVRLLGARSDVADLLCAADVAVFPSRWEGLPGTVIEAMALEVPIVASDIPQHREALGGVALALARAGDAEDLATALDIAFRAPDRQVRRHAADGRTRFEKYFTIETVADQMVEFYGTALSSVGDCGSSDGVHP